MLRSATSDASFRPSSPPPLLLIFVLNVLWGCAGSIDNPEAFYPAAEGGDRSAGVDAVTLPSLVQVRCFGCHEAAAAGDLDLASDGLAERLVGVTAATCPDQVLVEPGGTDGFLIDKLGPEPACGEPMPVLARLLTDDEIKEVRSWLADKLGLPVQGDAGDSAGDDDASQSSAGPTDGAGTGGDVDAVEQ